MPLLDGRYEIHSESAGPAGSSTFLATTPSGDVVRIAWYDISGEQEAAFERYRRLIRQLMRAQQAAVVDVVSRPGAHYVVWRIPPDGAAAQHQRSLEPSLSTLIREAGFDPETARSIRIDGSSGARLFELPFTTATDGRASVGIEAPAKTPRRWLPPNLDRGLLKTWGLSLLLLLSAALTFVAAWELQTNDAIVVLPDVVGLPYQSAAATLSNAGLRVRPVAIARDNATSGDVIATVPTAGTTLRPGREVLLRVAIPTGQLAPRIVPRLVGLSSVAASRATLEGSDLLLGEVITLHLDTPAGIVVAQSPAATQVVGEGSVVHLIASAGPRPILTFLPNLIGLGSAEAIELANLAGLRSDQLVIEPVPSSAAAPGIVLAQSLAPYRDFNRDGAVLRLLVAQASHGSVASGAEALHSAGLPALGGMSEALAREEARLFDVHVNYVADAHLPDGVIGQSLAVGAVPSDGPLFLTINARPVRVPRPEVEVVVRPLAVRELGYLWFIEPGIPAVNAVVYATTLEGERFEIARGEARGGGRVEGTWSTEYRGVVHFELELNGSPYGTRLRSQ